MQFRLNPDILTTVPLERIVAALLKRHNPQPYIDAQNYYDGEHDILKRQMKDRAKPNNRLVNNLAAKITDTITGYFAGKPISYVVSDADELYLDTLQDIHDYNDEQDHNSELAKSASIKGAAYELLYIDSPIPEGGDVVSRGSAQSTAQIRFVDVERENVIYVESSRVNAEPLLAIRLYAEEDLFAGSSTDNQYRRFAEVYTDREVLLFEINQTMSHSHNEDNATLILLSQVEHYFGGVPMVEYRNNKECRGDFVGVRTLVDAYNLAQSDTANDFEYFTDAYLILCGAGFDDEDTLRTMRESRVIELPDKESVAEWLIKTINDKAVENYKDRLRQDIHMLSGVPDMTDEQFAGQLSGVAIAYKIWGMEQIAATKERKFKRGLQRRLELITNILKLKGAPGWDWRHIDIMFSRNMPEHLVELVDMVTKLKGIVSDITLLAQLPFIEDPQEEQMRLEEQQGDLIDLESFKDDDDDGDAIGTTASGNNLENV